MNYSEQGGWDAVTGLSSLDNPVRQRLYEHVIGCDGPVARDNAAEAVGISRTLAAYHLDKLVEVGFLEAGYARPPGQVGPGAGRPAKQYSPAALGRNVSVPPREYQLLAELLATAVAADGSGGVGTRLENEARAVGRRTGAAPHEDLVSVLRRCGYRPHVAGDEGIQLRNCPFHALVERHRELICGLNLQLVRGVLEGRRDESSRAVLDPVAGRCCVRLTSPSQ